MTILSRKPASKSSHPFHTGNEKRLQESLARGNKYTTRQIAHIFKLRNPSAAIGRIVKNGMKIVREYHWNAKRKAATVTYFAK